MFRFSLLTEARRILLPGLEPLPELKTRFWITLSSNSRPEPTNRSDSILESLPSETDLRFLRFALIATD